VNELIIGTGSKDLWNGSEPENEAQFLDFYLNSRLGTALNIRFGVGIPTANRKDLGQRPAQISGADAGADWRLLGGEHVCRIAPPQSGRAAHRA
jgi:hypothetical protein